MQKIIKVVSVIASILPYLLQIVELFKNNKEAFEGLVKKKPIIAPPDQQKNKTEEPVEELEPLEKKK